MDKATAEKMVNISREAMIGLCLGYCGVPNAGPGDPYYDDAAKRVDKFIAQPQLEKILETSIAFARGFRSGCSANVTDEIDLLGKLKKERDAYFAENPVLRESLTPDPKPQGEARLRQGLEDIVRISTTAIEEKNPEIMVKIAIKALREAARVPPEATPSKPEKALHDETNIFDLMKALKVAMDLLGCKTMHAHGLSIGPTEAHGPLIGDFPSPPTDRLLEAAKAVLEWYGPLEADCMVALSKEVKAREATQCP